jgi:uracil-DNA glycosylase
MTLFADPSSAMETLANEVRVCTRCELAETRTHAVPGEGDPESRVLFVGHAPGSTDDATGKPYTGPGGALLDALFAQAGIERERVFITNLVKCWPWKEEFGNRVNRTPSAKEIKACAPVFLRQELEIMRPRAIVCLGGPTAQQFLGKDFKITQSRGEWLAWPDSSPMLKLIGTPTVQPAVMAILQPAYLIHLEQHSPEAFPGARQAMLRDLGKVKRVLDGEEPEIKGSSAVSDEETPF